MAKKVNEWARSCLSCQQAKIHRHTRASLQEFGLPDARFSHIHIDVVGPLPSSNGCSHLLTIVDRFSRWPEAIPVRDTTTSTLALAFALNWVARYGIPSEITSDRGAQFTSKLWADLMSLLGTKVARTTAYHPQSNGLVERFHRNLKDALRARLKGPNWVHELPWVLLGIRTAPKEDLGTSSAELVYGAPLAVPGDFLPAQRHLDQPSNLLERLRTAVGQLRPVPTSAHGLPNTHIPPALRACRFVFVRRDGAKKPLQPLYDGPYEVLEHGDKYFRLRIGTREDTISIDRIKPAHHDPGQPVIPAVPKPRGRPQAGHTP